MSQEINRSSLPVVFAATVGVIVSFSTIQNYAFSLFIVPMTQEFGWSRTQVSAAFMFYAWTMAALFPFSGRLMDRFGVKTVVLPGILLLTLALAAMATMTGALWQLYAIFVAFGFCGAAGGAVPYSKVVSGWFHQRRGLVLAMVSVGAGIVGAIVPQFTRILIEDIGWRGGFLALAGVALVLGVPVVALLLRESPVIVAARASGGRPGSTGQALGLTANEARRSRPFVLCVLAIALVILVNSSVHTHIAPLVSDRGLGVAVAAAVITGISVGGVLCRLLEGWLLDKVDTPRLALVFVVLVMAGLLLFHHGDSPAAFVAGGFLFGAGVTAEVSLIPYFFSRFFGLRSLAEIYGTLWSGAAIAGGLGPMLTGVVFDATGSYGASFWIAEGAILLVGLCFFFLPPYRFPAQLPAYSQPAAEDIPPEAMPQAR